MEGKRTEVPVAIGFEVDSTLLPVHADETGIHVTVDEEGQPVTVLRAEPTVVRGLASGMLTVEQAITAGELRGNRQDLAAVFGAN